MLASQPESDLAAAPPPPLIPHIKQDPLLLIQKVEAFHGKGRKIKRQYFDSTERQGTDGIHEMGK